MINITMLAQAAEAAPSAAFSMWDIVLFCVAVVAVIGLGIWKSRDESKDETGDKSAADYFLAGRGLTWWLVGFSLIAANISTEQFVGQSGKAADWLGMSIAGYEWMASITLVVVAFFFLPKLLRNGVYTIPEFLEYRYNTPARSTMAVASLLIMVGVPTATVIYSGAKFVSVFFQGYSLGPIDFGDEFIACCIIAFAGAIYVYVGGLKACAWTDLIWGAALIVGGGIVAVLAYHALGSADPQHLWETRVATSDATVQNIADASTWERFLMLNDGPVADGANGAGGKLHMVRPITDPEIPWTVLLLGLWIPNFFYWGLNQYIMQRTLASKSLAEGQTGIVFAAFLKLLIPFVVIIPGIMAYNLFSDDLRAKAVEKNYTSGAPIVVNEGAYRAAETAKGTSIEAIETNISEAARTVYPVTNEFINTEIEPARAILTHNVKLAYADDQVKQTETLAAINTAMDEVKADAADTTTNRTGRLELAKSITDINQEMIKKVQGESTVMDKIGAMFGSDNGKAKVGTKLVGYDYDAAFPTLLSRLLFPGLSWFILAAMFGAVVSSLASMLNSASTIFTMDVYHKLRKNAGSNELVRVGKIGVLVCTLIALGIAPILSNPKFGGVFTFIQEFQGFISPGVLCVFLFGFFVPRCPRYFGWTGIIAGVILYATFLWGGDAIIALNPDALQPVFGPFLNRMALTFLILVTYGAIATMINISRGGEAIVLPVNNKVALESSNTAKIFGAAVILLTMILYYIFW